MKSQIFLTPRDLEEVIKPVSSRIRVALMVLNVFLIVTGITLILLGIQLNRFVIANDNRPEPPPIWSLGVLPIVIGTCGIACVIQGTQKLLLVWIPVCVVIGVGSFFSFVSLKYLDPEQYDINIHIFGNCVQNGIYCKCFWDDSKAGLFSYPCAYIRQTSILYLSLVAVFILCTSTIVICVILGCVLTFCLKFCIPREQDTLDLHTTIYGISTRVVELPGLGNTFHTKDYIRVASNESFHDDHLAIDGKCQLHPVGGDNFTKETEYKCDSKILNVEDIIETAIT